MILTSLALAATLAGAAHLEVKRNGVTVPIQISIGIGTGEDPPQWIRERSLPPTESELTIDDLAPGVYLVLLRGPSPLQRTSGWIRVDPGKTSSFRFPITERVLAGHVLFGGAPAAGATIRLTNLKFRWEALIVTGLDGTIHTPIWSDDDEFALSVKGGPLLAAVATRATLDGAAPRLDLDIPARRLRGRVTDSEGEAIRGALVILEHHDEGTTAIRATTGPNGEFEFPGLDVGTVTLRVFAVGFLQPPPVNVAVKETDAVLIHDVVVSDGILQKVRVENARGEVGARALIICGVNAQVRSRTVTDALGRASVPTPPGENSVLYVLPSEGGVIVTRLPTAVADREKVLRIVAPSATASLRLTALTTDGKPVPGLSFLMRFNGELIPREVATELARRWKEATATDADGQVHLDRIAPGHYEFWPYGTVEEADDLVESSSVLQAPIAADVKTGENEIKVRFSARN